MAQIKINAIVIGRTDYRDNDRILALFSPTLGRIDAIARRAKSPKSPLLSASELFCSGEYVLFQSKEHATVVSCQVTDAFYPLREDYERFSHGTLMLEMSRVVVQPEQENERFFLHLLRSLAHLAYGGYPPKSVTAVFMMGLLSLNGFRPVVTRCASCGRQIPASEQQTGSADPAWFSVKAGGLLCRECRGESAAGMTVKDVSDLQQIMKKGLKALEDGLDVSSSVFSAVLGMVKDRLEAEFQSDKMIPL
ncbi:MAG: DNA repair protein RecO [Clostridia bacterium]|nr:DNA repair protein RecO [Clostridia bacterium]